MTGAGDNLVIDIGEILHVLHSVATKLKIPPDDIEEDIAHGVPDVALAIRGDPADIHLYCVTHGGELLFST